VISTRTKAILANLVTKPIMDAWLAELLNAEQARVCDILERHNAVICRDRSAARRTVVDPWVISASNRCYQIQLAMRGN
jgi:hypothetical protein